MTQKLRDALDAARNGLQWYRDAYPDADSGADDEMMAQIDEALAEPAQAPAATELGKLGDNATIRCRKCGEHTTIEFNHAQAVNEKPSCCGQTPCAHPGVGPCTKPAATPAPTVGAATRSKLEEWQRDGTLIDRIVGTLSDQEREIIRLESDLAAARAHAQPVQASLSDEPAMSLTDAIHALDIHNRSAKQMVVRISQNPNPLIEALRGLS